jgi:hypothetical protein
VQPFHLDGDLVHLHPCQSVYPLRDPATHRTALARDVAGVAEFDADADARGAD